MARGKFSDRETDAANDARAQDASYRVSAGQIVENHLHNVVPASDLLEKIKKQAADALPQPVYREESNQLLRYTPRAESELALAGFDQSLITRGIAQDKIDDLMADLQKLADKILGPEQGRG